MQMIGLHAPMGDTVSDYHDCLTAARIIAVDN